MVRYTVQPIAELVEEWEGAAMSKFRRCYILTESSIWYTGRWQELVVIYGCSWFWQMVEADNGRRQKLILSDDSIWYWQITEACSGRWLDAGAGTARWYSIGTMVLVGNRS
jgi:hypothetical protein